MHIEVLDPSDTRRVGSMLSTWEQAQAIDRPHDPTFSHRYEGGHIRHPLPDEPTTHHVAVDGDQVLASATVELPCLDNTGTGWIELIVHPEQRRRGIGSALWEHTRSFLVAEQRRLVVFEAPLDGAPGEGFARRIGAELGIRSARRILRVDEATRARAEQLAHAARRHAAAYDVHTVVGPTPERWLDGMAYLHGRMSTDAPLDDLEWEPENYDAARLRAREAMLEPQGLRCYTALATHRDTGAVAGFTTIGMCVDVPTGGHQWNTIVDPDHRGHRLGSLLKAENLRLALAHQPQLSTVITWNAVSNGPMVAVNEAMGFELLDHWGEWQVRL